MGVRGSPVVPAASALQCLMLLSAAVAPFAPTVRATGSAAAGIIDSALDTIPGFWHYALLAEDSQSAELVWRALPVDGSSSAAAAYAIQRWPNALMPGLGQEGYLTGLLSLEIQTDGTLGTLKAVDGSPGVTHSFYRILALAADGTVLAATRPSQPVATAGNVVLSSRPCSSGPCRKLLQTPTIQGAIDAATPGSTVIVLPDGSPYQGLGNTNLTFGGKNITLLAAAGPEATVIDCQGSPTCRAFLFTAAEGRGTEVSGFKIANGTSPQGGCVTITDGSPTFSSCVFQQCGSRDPTLPGNGGAVYVSGAAAAPLFQGCRFLDNHANYGGAIHVSEGSIEVQGCEFLRNDGAAGTGQGGALYLINTKPSIVQDTLVQGGSVGFSAGAISAQLAAEVRLERVRVLDNKSGSFAGAILVWGSNLTIVDSEVLNNTASVYGGGVLVQYGQYNATRTRHAGNAAEWGGGGGVSLFSAVALLKECELIGNRANFGGGLNAMRMNETNIMVPTIVSVNDTLIEGNIATDRGAAFNIESADLAALVNVTILNNVAAAKGGGGWCQSAAPVQIYGSRLQNNSAASGGGFFAEGPCPLVVVGSEFIKNSASGYGAGIAVGDGAFLDVSQSVFAANGAASCSSSGPLGGGGIFVGVEPFRGTSADQCAANESEVAYATVNLNTVSFVGNQAADRGGAVHVAAGSLQMNTVELLGNAAVGGDLSDGVGGAIALDERCSSTSGGCSPITAQLAGLNVSGNSAVMAGGGLYFAGSGLESSLEISESLFAGNAVSLDLQGAGGGLHLGHPNFTLITSQLLGNTGFFGGGLSVAADLSQGAVLSNLMLSSNNAQGAGPAAYWLRSKSPAASLVCDACDVQPANGSTQFATEALEMQYGGQPPYLVQTNRNFPPFEVKLLDFYGSVAATTRGICSVSVNSSSDAVLSSKGQEVLASQGVASFDSLQLKGVIAESYDLQITFEGASAPSGKLLPVDPLPPLPLSVTIAACPAGSQPTSGEDDCIECSDGTYNLDGGECLPCPDGADCAGGSQIRARASYWRSSNASVDFYPCMVSGVCLAGAAAGDAACGPGQEGPLCDVCQPEFFKLSGTCKTCGGAQSKAMLAVTVILLTLLAVALFARDWNFGAHGPGIMTKIKIFLSHFQMLALFRDYDVTWPMATSSALGWFEVVNAGFSMFAPECFFGTGSFYVVYIFQMTLPFVCVGTCVFLYYAAELVLRKLDPHRERRGQGSGAGGLVGWLEGLKVRCWKNAFWFVTLLYPRCAMTALELFGWKALDVGTFLKADFSIMVKYPGGGFVGTYVKYMVPGILLLILYAVIIPAFWFAAVYLNRNKLDDPLVQAKYGFLYASYSPRFPYWETTEMLRKFAIAFIPVFIPPQAAGSLQAATAQVVLLLYIMLTLRCWPFALGMDNWLQLASLTVLWLLLLSAGVNKWAELSSGGSTALAVVQLILSSGVGFLLAVAVFLNGFHLARQLSRRWSEKRLAAKAAVTQADANGSDDGEGGGSDGEGGGTGKSTASHSVTRKLSAMRAKLALGACLPCAAGGQHGKPSKGSGMAPLSSVDGEIAAAMPEGGADSRKVALASGGGQQAQQHRRTPLPVINVRAAVASRDEEEGLSPYTGDTPQSRRKLLRTSSAASRRSAADDLEMRLPKEGVQRSDSSTLMPWPSLPTLSKGAPQPPLNYSRTLSRTLSRTKSELSPRALPVPYVPSPQPQAQAQLLEEQQVGQEQAPTPSPALELRPSLQQQQQEPATQPQLRAATAAQHDQALGSVLQHVAPQAADRQHVQVPKAEVSEQQQVNNQG